HVRAQRVVRLDRRGDFIGILRADTVVHILAPVAIRPAVEGAFLDGRKVVGHQVAADLVAFVHDRPQLARARLYGQCRGVAQPGGVGLVFAGAGVDAPYAGAAGFRGHAAFGDVAVGPDADIQILPVRACGQRLGPVVVYLGRQRSYRVGRPAGLGLPRLVVEPHQRVLVGHIKIIAHQRQPVRRVQPFGESGLLVRAVAVGVAEQGEPVAALYRTGALGLDNARDHVFGLEFGGIAPPALGHQDVA